MRVAPLLWPCITEAALWTGFLVTCIISYEDNAEKEVLRGPGPEKMLGNVCGIRQVVDEWSPPSLSLLTDREG